MTGPNDNVPMTFEEKVREDYFYMEKPNEISDRFRDEWEAETYKRWEEADWLNLAADLARKQARRLKNADDEEELRESAGREDYESYHR